MIKIRNLCKAFAKLDVITLGETPADAYNRCHDLSMAFSLFCLGKGEKAETVRLESPHRPLACTPEVLSLLEADMQAGYEHMVARYITHEVVWFPKHKLFVDWTARQFWPDLPHPWIATTKEMEQYWESLGA